MAGLFLFLLLPGLAGCQNPQNYEQSPSVTAQPSLAGDTAPTAPKPAVESEPHSPTPIATPTPTDEPVILIPGMSSPEIFDFDFFTPLQGWAVSRDQNQILITADGGTNWLAVTPTDLGALSEGMTSFWLRPFFLDQDTAWFMANTVSSATLFHTQDGGQTWVTTSPPFDNARLEFLDQNLGYALVDLGAGAGSHYVAFYQTLDGGTSWTMVFTHEPGEIKSLPNGGSKNGITFRGVDQGWIGGTIPMEDNFYLFFTQDGGATWEKETDIALPEEFAGSMLDVWQPVFINATNAILPVRAYPPSGGIFLLIYRSDDFGETWVYRGAVEDGEALDFITLDEGWLAAGATLFNTLDGGATWSAVLTAGIAEGEVFLNVDFVDHINGWVLTTPDSTTWELLKLYRTDDGGANWSVLVP
jgi:photosystem II stability/assembly factor-like uncharacterized protein